MREMHSKRPKFSKFSRGSMPPDPPRISRFTSLAKHVEGVFQYLSAYFSNSAIYSISYWKPWSPHTSSQLITSRVQQQLLYTNGIVFHFSLAKTITWLWRWLSHSLSKTQSPTTVLLSTPITQMIIFNQDFVFKDGDYYCYCAYVLRISRYSDFLSPMLTNTGIFLRGLKISGESRS